MFVERADKENLIVFKGGKQDKPGGHVHGGQIVARVYEQGPTRKIDFAVILTLEEAAAVIDAVEQAE